MLKFFLLIILLSNISLPQKQTWATTRFEKFWFTKVNKMKFRDPFTFMPLNIKFGYYSYGGDEYWKQWRAVLQGDEEPINSPIKFNGDNTFFDDILNQNDRKMLIAEIDLMKYNFCIIFIYSMSRIRTSIKS